MGEEKPGREVTPEAEACPKSPKSKKGKSTRQPLSYLPKWNRTQIIALSLTALSLFSIFSVGRWYLLMLPLQGNNVIWSKTFGGPGGDNAVSLIQLDDGGFAFCGSTSSWGLGGHWNSTDGGNDMWLARLDETGDILWNHTYGSTLEDAGISILECIDGGFALFGMTYVNRSGEYDPDVLLVRTDENGNQLWNKTYGCSGLNNPTSFVNCNDGGFALAGYTIDYSRDQYYLWLVRTDSGGNLLWNHTYGGDETQGGVTLLETDSGFLLFTTGSWWTTGIDVTNNDAYLFCTNSTGNLLWNRTYDSGGHDYGLKIIPERTGGYTLVSRSGPTQRPWNLWFIRISENGDILWDNIVGLNGGMAFDIIQCYDGGFALVGTFSPTQYWMHHDLFFARTDTRGNLLWQQLYGFEEVWDSGISLIQATDSSFVLCGQTYLAIGVETGEALILCIRDTPIAYYTITRFMFFGSIIAVITFIIIGVLIIAQRRWFRP